MLNTAHRVEICVAVTKALFSLVVFLFLSTSVTPRDRVGDGIQIFTAFSRAKVIDITYKCVAHFKEKSFYQNARKAKAAIG